MKTYSKADKKYANVLSPYFFLSTTRVSLPAFYLR